MSYLTPPEFVKKMVDAGESKVFMASRDVLIRGIMAGAILAVAVAFAVTTAVQTGLPIVGALVFPVGFCLLNLMGFDLVTGVFAQVPLAWLNKRPGVTLKGVFKNWSLVFVGNFIGTEEDHIAPWKGTFKVYSQITGPVQYPLATSAHILGIISPPVNPPKRRYWTGDTRGQTDPRSWREGVEKRLGFWRKDRMQWLDDKCGELTAPPSLGNREYSALQAARGS